MPPTVYLAVRQHLALCTAVTTSDVRKQQKMYKESACEQQESPTMQPCLQRPQGCPSIAGMHVSAWHGNAGFAMPARPFCSTHSE